MPKQLQIRGGTTAQHSTFTGALREITVDTDKDTLVVHDGSTVGGFPLARESVVNASLGTKVNKNADIVSGTATKVTYDSKGLVTSGSTPTTLAGYSIADSYTKTETNTQISNAVNGLLDAAPGTLDTLNELAAALGDDPNFATTVSNNIATKVTKVTSTDNAIVRFDGVNGNVQNSSVFINDSGNIGIGTPGPVNSIHINLAAMTNSYNGLNVQYNGTSSSFGFFTAGSTYTYGSVGSSENWIYSSTKSINIMANGAGSVIKFAAGNNAEKVRIDASGNIGVGVIPSTWDYNRKVLEIKGTASSGGGSINSDGSDMNIWQNAKYDVAFKYIANGSATGFGQYNGWFTWNSAPSGTAGAAITWTTAMTLDTNSNLAVAGTISSAGVVIGTLAEFTAALG